MEPRQDIRAGCGRLAPSPTGGLHFGHARTFLIAWLASRRERGPIAMRIEDLDAARARPEATAAALVDLAWLGLDWDEGPDVGGPRGPYVQSQRRAIHDEALARLKAAELVYPCVCTRAEIERAASAPHAEDEGPTYPGTCAGRSAADAEALGDRPFAWRFRVPDGPVVWDDLVLGPRSLDPARLGGDFLVGRNGLGPSYQLAVVVDDALMGVDRVIRGDDLVPSTPRQILLYRALGWTPPRFGHVPLVLGPDGRRLAKRDGSIKLATLRERGLDPRRLVGLLARSCGLADESIDSAPADWIDAFDLARLPREPWTADPEAWLRLGSFVVAPDAGGKS
ncbi:tRNA glutamyl-Q(34) synthetase GluQRS [Paludisphaera sp.]|uniref:tRNA glutamyl-Q(34) synthetase GluQRS n=1 Tax=Paludisphaera sp. TaxID=2017432 RepID=UPI00301DA4DF